jgi:prepilin-type processing-associated H-X9-DG protein
MKIKPIPSIVVQIVFAVAVVLLWIDVIHGLLSPLSGKEGARHAACQNNLKQIGIGLMQYSEDNDEHFPPATRWGAVIYPYIKARGVYHCPDDPMMPPDQSDVSVLSPLPYPISYAINSNVVGLKMGKLSDPSKTVAACEYASFMVHMDNINDTSVYGATNGSSKVGISAWGGSTQMGKPAPDKTRHGDMLMFLAADGHVRFLRPEAVSGGSNAVNVGAPGSQYSLTFSAK